MNKKKLLVLLPAALLALSGCNPSEPGPSSSEKSSEASQVVSSEEPKKDLPSNHYASGTRSR